MTPLFLVCLEDIPSVIKFSFYDPWLGDELKYLIKPFSEPHLEGLSNPLINIDTIE